MLLDYTCHSSCDSCMLVVFTFILGAAAVNERTILKYNKANYDNTRRVFQRNLATSLIISYIKQKKKVKNLKSMPISTINPITPGLH